MAKSSIFVRTPFNYSMDEVSSNTGLECPEPSKAQQHMKDECDINVIVGRFIRTNELPSSGKLPEYGDFTGVDDYRTALHDIMKAEAAFADLPAKVRKHFDNDPALFVDAMTTPGNESLLMDLGLIPKAHIEDQAPPDLKGEPDKA